MESGQGRRHAETDLFAARQEGDDGALVGIGAEADAGDEAADQDPLDRPLWNRRRAIIIRTSGSDYHDGEVDGIHRARTGESEARDQARSDGGEGWEEEKPATPLDLPSSSLELHPTRNIF